MQKIKFIGINFNSKMVGKYGDYKYMMTQDDTYKLLIYNENTIQWKNVNDLRAGGGNAVVRPLRIDNFLNDYKKIHSIGIPTGPEFDNLTNKIKDMIDISLLNLYNIILKNKYEEVYFCINDDNLFGYSIFKPDIKVRKYISDGIKKIAKNINGDGWEKNFLFYKI